jgi:hypothetical protein
MTGHICNISEQSEFDSRGASDDTTLLKLCDKVCHRHADVSSVSGPYSAIDPYVKPFFPPDPPQMTALCEFLSYCLDAATAIALKFHPKHEKHKQKR